MYSDWCLAFLPLCQFAPWLVRPLADSPPGSFASWLICPLALSPRSWLTRPLACSKPEHGGVAWLVAWRSW